MRYSVILFPIGTAFFGALFAATLKELRADTSIAVAVWARYVVSALLLIAFGYLRNLRLWELAPGTKAQHLRRTVFALTGLGCFTAAAPIISVSEMVSLQCMTPLLLALLAWLFLKEKPTLARVLAILCGISGVLLVAQPSAIPDHQKGVVLVLVGCVFGALCDFESKKLTKIQSSYSITTALFIIGSVITTAVLPFVWETPPLTSVPLLLALGFFGAMSQLLLVHSLSNLPASVVAPFLYTSFLWAILFDTVIFRHLPNGMALFGAALIMTDGVFATIAARQARRRSG